MRIDDGHVIPNFAKQALTGKDLAVYGDGEQARSFCYVSDMIDELVALLESTVEDFVNLGNPDERTINELAEIVLEVTGNESGITYEELPPQDPQVRRPDISKAHSKLDWTPNISLREGLQQSIGYFESRL
jgi:dTDP-glucose 4,6-dehydratase